MFQTNTTESAVAGSSSPSQHSVAQNRVLTESPLLYNTPIKKRLSRRVLELSSKLQYKNKQIKRLQDRTRFLKKKVASLKDILRKLEEKCLINSENAAILSSIGVHNKEIVKRQILQRAGHTIRRKYPPELRTFALTLNFYSTKAYKYVRKTFSTCLPSLKTLSKWYQCVDGRPGFTKEALNALKIKSDLAHNQLYCTLVFDEIKIKNKVEYHPASQRNFGYVDFGSGLVTDCNDECSEALVFLIVPINGRWKVPIAYFLIHGISGEQKASLVLQALSLCQDVNISVKAITFDGCPANLSMAKKLGCNLDPKHLKTYFKHPDTNCNVVIFLDPCHMMKLVRNSFEYFKTFEDNNGNIIKWEYLKTLQALQEKEMFHMANKLRAHHIYFKNNIMKVKLATQLFSQSVANALIFCNDQLKLKQFEGVDATANMLLILNDLFDILDSKVHSNGFKRALNKNNHADTFNKLDECKNYLLSLSVNIWVKDSFRNVKLIESPRFTGFLGLCVAIDSVKYLFNDLIINTECPITYIPFHKLSQDHIELFFCNVRSHGGANDNPTPRQFETIYKKILIHTELDQSSSGNCVALENIAILNCSSAIERINSTTERHTIESEQNDDFEDLEMLELISLSQFCENMIEYIAGFVVSSLFKRLKCTTCLTALVSLTENKKSLIFLKDKGGLIYPSEMVTKICRRCELVIKKYLNDDFHKRFKREFKADFFITKALNSFVGEQLFPEIAFHQFHSDETNHIIDLTKCVMKKYIDTRLVFLSKTTDPRNVVRRVYRKLIHFKNQ